MSSNETYRVCSNELQTLGFRQGDSFRILPIPPDCLFAGDIVAAVINGFRFMGQLLPEQPGSEVKLAVPFPRQLGEPVRRRVYYASCDAILGLVERVPSPSDHSNSGH